MKKAQYKKELQEQMILGAQSKRYLYEEFLREKKMIDDIIQRIHDEDEREMQERMCKVSCYVTRFVFLLICCLDEEN